MRSASILLSQKVAEHVKVVQSGQGADEVFAGYHWYPPMVGSGNPAADYARAFCDRSHEEYRRAVHPRFHGEDYSRAFIQGHFARPGAEAPVDKALRIDQLIMLVDDPVKRVDNMTMAWGLEARVPFLDHELVELAARIPDEYKLCDEGKCVLKAVGRRVIPAEVIDRPKGYFPVPALKYLRGEVLDMVRDLLHSRPGAQRALFSWTTWTSCWPPRTSTSPPCAAPSFGSWPCSRCGCRSRACDTNRGCHPASRSVIRGDARLRSPHLREIGASFSLVRAKTQENIEMSTKDSIHHRLERVRAPSVASSSSGRAGTRARRATRSWIAAGGACCSVRPSAICTSWRRCCRKSDQASGTSPSICAIRTWCFPTRRWTCSWTLPTPSDYGSSGISTRTADRRDSRVRLLNSREDAEAINRLYVSRRMVPPGADFIWENRTSKVLHYWVAQDEQDGSILGAVNGVDHVAAFEDPENGSSLWALAVDAQAPYPGIGEALVRQVLEYHLARRADPSWTSR